MPKRGLGATGRGPQPLPDPGRSITSIANLLGISPGTLCNHIPNPRELRAGAVPRQLATPTR